MKSLSKAVGPMENTVMEIASEHYQSHFERITDYLLCGPGIWWEETPQGILFLDGSSEKEYQDSGPTLQHFSSLSSSDVELHLLQQWEACCSTGIHLPAKYLRFYGECGDLQEISIVGGTDGRDQSACDSVQGGISLQSQSVSLQLVTYRLPHN